PLPEMVERAGDAAESSPRGFRGVLVQVDLLPLWSMTAGFSLALAAVFIFLKTFVMHTGIGSVGGFFSAYAGVALLLRISLGWLPDRLGAKRVLHPAIATQVCGFLVLAAAADAREVLLAGALCGAGTASPFPSSSAWW
ncbi:MAG: hypothetical protein ACE5FL_14505, partial [Myxococcota bacterium]